jgi:hypothetical protein
MKEENERAFLKWAFSVCILYGQPVVDWWKEEGLELFFKWAEKKGIKYMRLEDE